MVDIGVKPIAEIRIRVYRAATDTWEEVGGKDGSRIMKIWQYVTSSAQAARPSEKDTEVKR